MPISPDNPLTPGNGVVITSRTFTDVDFVGSGGVSYLNGGVLNKYKCVIDFYTLLSFENKLLTFNAAADTITNSDVSSYASFVTMGWRVGMTITVSGTVSNNASFTITAVTDKVITVNAGITNETANNAYLWDDTPVTNMDFYYNLIENSEVVNYLSKTDRNAIQRFTFSGLDATNVTPVNGFVASSSFGWVTNTVDAVGECTEVTIEGVSITNHKQIFKLIQYFTVAPVWIKEQYTNFNELKVPSYFDGTKALKHIFKLDAKHSNDPDIPFTGGITNVSGLTNWFNQNNIKTRVEYDLTSIEYSISGDAVDRIDIVQPTDVVITLNSKSGLFDNTGTLTKFALDFFLCPQDESEYVGTETTLRQNIANDRRVFNITAASGNGEYFGTAYQVLTDIVPTYVDANTVEIAFTVELSTELQDLLIAREPTDRVYAISVTTQDIAIATTTQTDRVPVLCAFEIMGYDQTNPDLLNIVNDDFEIYHFPYYDQHERNAVKGYEGEPVIGKVNFRVESLVVAEEVPTLKRAGLQIVAVKTGEDDFVIEQKVFTTEFVKRDCGVQAIDITEERNFNDAENFNTSSIIRNDDYDSGTMAGFTLTYPFALRYEYWLNIIASGEQFQHPLYDRCSTEDVTQAWKSIIDDGWTLKLKFIADVEGYDGFVTSFDAYTDIEILEFNEPTADVITAVTKYYNQYGIEVNSIVRGERTRIETTFTGTFSPLPDGYDSYYAYIFADLPNTGSINNRRFASTVYDADDCPFTATIADRDADLTIESENLTINLYGTDTIIVACWYDDTKQSWGQNNEEVIIATRIGFLLEDNVMLFEDGGVMLYEDGDPMLYENDALT